MLQSVSPKHDLPLKPEGQAAKPERTGTWAPFSIQAFRIIWICNLFANLGTWAQSVAAAWVVTDAHASPLMVAMIQVAAALPLVLLSILSGVIADNHDRRKIMLWGLSFEMTGAMFATLLAFLGYLDPVLLIISILWISLGGSVTIPAWQAAVNEQVPARMVSDAVLLNSVNYNVARAAGPALGGLLLSAVGPAWVFLFNSFCYMALIWAIWQWRRDVPKRSLPPEGILEGVTAALRFTQYSTVTRLVMMRSFAFGLSASAVWALLPLLAHRNPDGDAAIYGYMLGALGLGAILGSTQVSRLRQRIGSSRLISLAGFTLALILLTLGLVDNLWVLFPVLILGGGCWIGALATYNSAVQILVPDWIKARALALYQTALYGGLALGSFLWGHLHDRARRAAGRRLPAAGLGDPPVQLAPAGNGRRQYFPRAGEHARAAELRLQHAAGHGAGLHRIPDSRRAHPRLRSRRPAAAPPAPAQRRGALVAVPRREQPGGLAGTVPGGQLDPAPAHARPHDPGRQDRHRQRHRPACRRRSAADPPLRELRGEQLRYAAGEERHAAGQRRGGRDGGELRTGPGSPPGRTAPAALSAIQRRRGG